jgi:hypothetical protein
LNTTVSDAGDHLIAYFNKRFAWNKLSLRQFEHILCLERQQ